MARQTSFSIVNDDDDDEDFEFSKDGALLSPANTAPVAPSTSRKASESAKHAPTRTQPPPPQLHQVSRHEDWLERDEDDSDHSDDEGFAVNSLIDDEVPTTDKDLDLLKSGPSNGRQTVTKMRAPQPQMLNLSSESESDDSDMVDKKNKLNYPGEYDPKQYENLDVASDIKDLFQFITKYVPQQLGHDYKFKPFIPEYLPAVGDIDAFLKVIPPELNVSGEPVTYDQSNLGLKVLDEPAANQSDPAVLHLQLRAATVNINPSADVVIKKVPNVEKNVKTIDKWIKDISDLHKSKTSPVLKYSNAMPDLDDLMEEWPEQVENHLKIHGFPSYNLPGPLTRYIDIICCLFDIPIYQNRIESLHLLFSLYAAIKTSHLFRPVSKSTNNKHTEADQLVLD